jgi:hypothetical protein
MCGHLADECEIDDQADYRKNSAGHYHLHAHALIVFSG